MMYEAELQRLDALEELEEDLGDALYHLNRARVLLKRSRSRLAGNYEALESLIDDLVVEHMEAQNALREAEAYGA